MEALSRIAAQSWRCNLAAVLSVIGMLASRPAADQPADEELETLRGAVEETGVHFLGIDDGHVSFTLHGHAHQPAGAKQIAEMLGEIRQTRRS